MAFFSEMEAMSARDCENDLISRISKLIGILNGPIDARRKERRSFVTRPLAALRVSGYELNWDKLPYYLLPTELGVPIFDDLKALLKRDITRTDDCHLRIKPSTRTKDADSKWRSLFEVLRRDIGSLVSFKMVPTLRDLFRLYDREKEYIDAVAGTYQDTPYAQNLVRTLSQDFPSLESWRSLNPYGEKQSVRLRTKLYEQRGEVRAFAVDKDKLRTLLGSIIHKLLRPDKWSMHEFPPYDTTFPGRDSNVLNLALRQKPSDEVTIIFGDISSFTASFRNVWIVLLRMISIIESDPVDPEIIVDVGGSLLSVRLLEVLKNYVTMASGVEVEDEEDSYYAVGSMLGVAGADTVAKVVFALFLRVMCKRTRDVTVFSRIAGDDFAIIITSHVNQPIHKLRAIDFLRTEIQRYIGFIKEWNQISFQCLDDDRILPFPFCKKKVRIKTEVGLDLSLWTVRIVSQYNVPVYGVLLRAEPSETVGFEAFEHSLKAVPYVPERELIQRRLTTLYAEFNARPLMIRTSSLEELVRSEGGYTDRMFERISRVPALYSQLTGSTVRTTLTEKLRALSPRSYRVCWAPGDDGKRRRITLSCSDETCKDYVYEVKTLLDPLDDEGTERIREAFKRLRQALSDFDPSKMLMSSSY